MKRIFILMALALATISANAQTTQTKTLDLGDDVTVTYSYYIDDNGEEVKHGKMTVIEAPVNNNARKGKKTVTCNYQHNKITGTFTYACNMSHYEKYIDYSKGIDYNVTNGAYEASTMWKKVRDQKENFTVEVFDSYLTGNINISFNARYANYQLLTLVGKAEKGVLIDGTTFELKQEGETLESYQNTAPDFKNAKYVDFEAGNKYGTGQYQYYSDGVVIDFGRCYFTLKYPRYTKPYISLNEIDYWNKYKSGEGDNIGDSIIYISTICDGTKPYGSKKEVRYDLLDKDIEFVSQLLDSLKRVKLEREEQAKIEQEERKKQYDELFSKVASTYNACIGAEWQKYNSLYGETQCTLLYEKEDKDKTLLTLLGINEGKTLLTLLDINVENIVCGEINKHRKTIIKLATSINRSYYENIKNHPEAKDLDTLKNYLSRVNPEMLDTLKQIRAIAPKAINKCKEVASLYTKTSSTSSYYQERSRENSSYKVIKKPIIYNAYIEIAKYISDGIKNKSLTDLSNAITLLDKINDKMILFSTSKTKDLEKSLQVASTPEEKLNLFLQQ